MSDGKSPARKALSALIILATIAGLYNVIADNAEVLAQAKQVGCDGSDCAQTRESRWPWAQGFTFQSKRGSVDVTCKRSLFLVGAYACTKQ
jgi:hypothetical protein